MPRRAKVHHAPRSQLDDVKHVHDAEEQVDHGQDVTGTDILRMILREGVPSLGRQPEWSDATQAGLDGVLRDADEVFGKDNETCGGMHKVDWEN